MNLKQWLSWFPLVLIAGCANAPAPPPEATAEVQVDLEAARDAVANAKANLAAQVAFWSQSLKDAKTAHVQGIFEAQVRAESQPTAEAFLAAVAARDAKLKSLFAEIDAKARELGVDANLAVADEAVGAGLDYVTEISAREKKVAALRKMVGIGAKKQ